MECKICTKCNQEKPLSEFYHHRRDGYSYWCKSCSREYRLKLKEQGYWREYYQRPRVKKMRARAIKKYRKHPYTKPMRQARRRANHLKDTGLILAHPCQVCGGENTEMHHPDYEQPEQVVWLCRKHHIELHKLEVAKC